MVAEYMGFASGHEKQGPCVEQRNGMEISVRCDCGRSWVIRAASGTEKDRYSCRLLRQSPTLNNQVIVRLGILQNL